MIRQTNENGSISGDSVAAIYEVHKSLEVL